MDDLKLTGKCPGISGRICCKDPEQSKELPSGDPCMVPSESEEGSDSGNHSELGSSSQSSA